MKIFGIGLPKTGTTSLQKALAILGYKTLHGPMRFREQMRDGNYALKNKRGKRKWDAIVNFGEWTYPILDENFPDAKFILTTRDFDSWMISCRTHFNKGRGVWEETRKEIFGTCKFRNGGKEFSDTYYRHKKEVVGYFESRYPNIYEKLLIIDICSGESEEIWEKLCNFLDKPVLNRDFPRRNVDKRSKRRYKKHQKSKESKKSKKSKK